MVRRAAVVLVVVVVVSLGGAWVSAQRTPRERIQCSQPFQRLHITNFLEIPVTIHATNPAGETVFDLPLIARSGYEGCVEQGLDLVVWPERR